MRMQKYTDPDQVKFTVSVIQSKITWYAKRQENMTHNKKNNQLIKINFLYVQKVRERHGRYKKDPNQIFRGKIYNV